MVDNAITQNEINVITASLDILIEDLQSEMKTVPFDMKEKYSRTIKVAREAKSNILKRGGLTAGQAKLILFALRSFADLISEDLINNTNSSERDENLEYQKYVFSAIRKIKSLFNLSDN